MGDDVLPVQRQRCPAGQPEHRERAQGRQGVRPVEQRTGSTFIERSVGAWMHIEHILGLYVFAACQPLRPRRTCTTPPWSVNSMHKHPLRAGSRAVQPDPERRRSTASTAAAHVEAWNSDAEWQGARRRSSEALTAIDDDWGESVFAANVVFEPLIGELFRSRTSCSRLRPGNGDFVTPTVMGAGEYDYAQRDLRWTQGDASPLLTQRQGVRRPQRRELLQGWLSKWVPQCHGPRPASDAAALVAGRSTSPRGSRTPSTGPRAGSAGIVTELGPGAPEGAFTVTLDSRPPRARTRRTTPLRASAGVTLMNNQVGVVVAEVMDRQEPGVTITHAAVDDPGGLRSGPDGLRLRRDLRGARRGGGLLRRLPSSRRTCPPTTAA